MTIKRIGMGKRMSACVVYGGVARLAGFVAEAAAGKSVKEQTADILAQIDATLAEAGTDKTKILKARCSVPAFDGTILTTEWKEALWARFYTGAPRQLRQSVERYNIVKRA